MTTRTLLLFALLTHLGAAEPSFALPAPVAEVLEQPDRFRAFAAPVRCVADELLAQEVPPAGGLAAALSIRVHLALLEGDDRAAAEVARRIRARAPAGPERDYAGLTTAALAAARGGDGAVAPAGFRAEFARLLAGLPRDEPTRAFLAVQRRRLEELRASALSAQAAAIARELDGRREVTLAEADRIVRWRHRAFNLAPLSEALAAAFDEAIGQRTPP